MKRARDAWTGPVIEILDDNDETSADRAKRSRLDKLHVQYAEKRATLTPQQQDAFDVALLGQRNMHIGGGAGVGKSHVLRAMIESLDPTTLAVTASTGIAAA